MKLKLLLLFVPSICFGSEAERFINAVMKKWGRIEELQKKVQNGTIEPKEKRYLAKRSTLQIAIRTQQAYKKAQQELRKVEKENLSAQKRPFPEDMAERPESPKVKL